VKSRVLSKYCQSTHAVAQTYNDLSICDGLSSPFWLLHAKPRMYVALYV